MTPRVRTIAVTVAAVAAGWLAYRWWVPDDEVEIRRVLERIEDGVDARAAEGDVGRVARAASLASDFDADVSVEGGAPFNRMRGRESVIGSIARLNGIIRNLDVEFHDIDVEVAQDVAEVSLVAEARFDEGSGGRGAESRALSVVFKKAGERWVVARVTLVEPLGSPR